MMELNKIKGLGTKRIETLKNRGIESAEDLALYFPKTYYDLNSKDIFQEDGKFKLLNCEVISDVKVVRAKGNFTYSYAECLDISNNKFKAVWYNQPYIKNAINNSDKLYLYGKNSNKKRNYFVVSNFKNHNKIKKDTNLLSIYKTFSGIGQSILNDSIAQALLLCNIDSYLPKEFDSELNFTFNDAIKFIHNPENLEQLNIAKQRIDIENILPFIKISEDIKKTKLSHKTQKYSAFDDIFTRFCDFLPYTLTQPQLNCLYDIKQDMLSNHSMNRLIQGDVGTGKTIVSLIPSAVCVASGYSCFLIAPTEILAKQHYTLAKEYFNKLGLNVEFLSSSTKPLERRMVIQKLEMGKPILLIGTHSCLGKDIPVDNLGLLIIDEQHRFGVKQRASLIDRNPNIDFLMLSATPIPRSMSIVYYGGLDISILHKAPKEKQIQTNIISPQKENDMWNFIKDKISTGSKVYVICSNIDENDDDDYIGLSVNEMYTKLCNIFSKDIVLMAHGKLDKETENKVLEKFNSNDYKILVSTTIVEVGVDVKEADIIVLVSPEKFGLATLHQLRGRVGRAGQQSYCFCLSKNINEKSAERIKYFKEHLNGFEIAEFDYKNRGSGNLLGTTQHGKTEDIFEYISLETYNKAKLIYDKLSKRYNTDEIFKENKLYNLISFKNLN